MEETRGWHQPDILSISFVPTRPDSERFAAEPLDGLDPMLWLQLCKPQEYGQIRRNVKRPRPHLFLVDESTEALRGSTFMSAFCGCCRAVSNSFSLLEGPLATPALSERVYNKDCAKTSREQ